MVHDINTRLILAVFEKITSHGEEIEYDGEHMHILEGIRASTDFDGYTVYLEDDEVKVRTGFHNTFKIDSESTRAADNFILKMKQIESNYD